MVERNLAKVDVVGSNPIIRSFEGLLLQVFFLMVCKMIDIHRAAKR